MAKIIVVSEDGMFTNAPIAVTELTDLFCAGITATVQQVREQYKAEDNAEEIDKELFDCLNHSFSKCLENAFPELELRPELTEQAILELENRIIAEKVGKVVPITEGEHID